MAKLGPRFSIHPTCPTREGTTLDLPYAYVRDAYSSSPKMPQTPYPRSQDSARDNTLLNLKSLHCWVIFLHADMTCAPIQPSRGTNVPVPFWNTVWQCKMHINICRLTPQDAQKQQSAFSVSFNTQTFSMHGQYLSNRKHQHLCAWDNV